MIPLRAAVLLILPLFGAAPAATTRPIITIAGMSPAGA